MSKRSKPGASAARRREDKQKALFGESQQPDLTYGRIDEDGLPKDYVPTTIEEYKFIGTVLANGWKAGKSVLDYYQKANARTAFAVSVVRSEPTAMGYRIDFQFANLSPHSVYLEDLLVLDPYADAEAPSIRLLNFTLHDTTSLDTRQVGPSISFPSDTSPQPSATPGKHTLPPMRQLPWLIRPEDKPQLALLVQPDAKLWFDQAKVGIAKARISFLGEESPQSVAWRFRVRQR